MNWIRHCQSAQRPGLYFRVLAPSPRLRRFVRYYWVLIDRADAPQTDEYLAPDGFEEIIFSYAEGYRRRQIVADSTTEQTITGSYVVGCKSAGVSCARIGTLAMVGIKLWPQCLHSLLDHPLEGLLNTTLELSRLNHRELSRLEDRLFEARDERQIKVTLDETLERMALSRNANDLVDFSLRRIFESRGTVAVDEIAAQSGRHYRTIERSFKERVGLPPKSLARIVRFKHAFDALNRPGSSEKTGTTVLDFGYYDPSHFAKDFRQFTGTTPSRFMRQRTGLSTDVFRFCLGLDLHRLDRDAEEAFCLRSVNFT